jgi:GAF domain-containing protein
MELEEVIDQLTARAQDVLAAQGRLRQLLRANAGIVGDLSLPVVLRQIVSSARDLVQARFAALGVVRDGVLEEFIHTGMDAELVERIGRLPQGEGILGLLIDQPQPVRLDDLNRHRQTVGFPDGHPPMKSFLGVPIRVRDRVFGNLYLTESVNGSFSVDDEQLVTALAATAGVAIANARLFEETEQQRRWLSASSELTQRLFEGSHESPLELVLRYAALGAQADSAAFVLSEEGGGLRVAAATGLPSEELLGRVVAGDETVAAHVIGTGEPVMTQDYRSEYRPPVTEDPANQVSSVVGVPLRTADQTTRGALTLGRVTGRPPFSAADRDQLASFATQANVALELERARSDREELRLLEDHDRIAVDLHDHVIKQLFAVGMGLAAMVERVSRSDQKQRLNEYVDTLDQTIQQIRATIFQLSQELPLRPALSARVDAVLHDHDGLDIDVDARVDDASLALVGDELSDDLVDVLREILWNIVRPSEARRATVTVEVAGTQLVVEVDHDGADHAGADDTNSLEPLRRRAEHWGGSVELRASDPKGALVRWTASVPQPESKTPSGPFSGARPAAE